MHGALEQTVSAWFQSGTIGVPEMLGAVGLVFVAAVVLSSLDVKVITGIAAGGLFYALSAGLI